MRHIIEGQQRGGRLKNVGSDEVFFPPLPEIDNPNSLYQIIVDVDGSDDVAGILRVYAWPNEGEPPLLEMNLSLRSMWEMQAYVCGLHVSLQADVGIITCATLRYAIRTAWVSPDGSCGYGRGHSGRDRLRDTKPMKNRLTHKQRAFIEHYLAFGTGTFFNATQSAKAAGYNGSDATLAVTGWHNLRKTKIRQHIEARLAEAGANADELIHRWLTVTRVDLSPYVTPNGLDLKGLKEAGLGFLIKGVRFGAGGKTIYDLRDPEKAEEQLAKHLGMFVERREHSGSVEVITKTVGGGVVEEL